MAPIVQNQLIQKIHKPNTNLEMVEENPLKEQSLVHKPSPVENPEEDDSSKHGIRESIEAQTVSSGHTMSRQDLAKGTKNRIVIDDNENNHTNRN